LAFSTVLAALNVVVTVVRSAARSVGGVPLTAASAASAAVNVVLMAAVSSALSLMPARACTGVTTPQKFLASVDVSLLLPPPHAAANGTRTMAARARAARIRMGENLRW
jgi:hypothetical protein